MINHLLLIILILLIIIVYLLLQAIPQLLSTAMANDETSCIEKPNPKYMNIPSDWDNIHNHNDNVEDILENFTNAVDKWKENYKNKGKKVIPK